VNELPIKTGLSKGIIDWLRTKDVEYVKKFCRNLEVHKRQSILFFTVFLMKLNEDCVDNIRYQLENTTSGKDIVACDHNRHLYAVLKPTRRENICRIINILRTLSPFGFNTLLGELVERSPCGKRP